MQDRFKPEATHSQREQITFSALCTSLFYFFWPQETQACLSLLQISAKRQKPKLTCSLIITARDIHSVLPSLRCSHSLPTFWLNYISLKTIILNSLFKSQFKIHSSVSHDIETIDWRKKKKNGHIKSTQYKAAVTPFLSELAYFFFPTGFEASYKVCTFTVSKTCSTSLKSSFFTLFSLNTNYLQSNIFMVTSRCNIGLKDCITNNICCNNA